MAQSRFIDKSILTNYRLNSLPLEIEYLFVRLILLADAEGRLQGNSKLVNRLVFPLRDYSDQKIEGWLNELMESKDDETGLGLIERYKENRHEYIWLPGFDKHQKGLRKDREAKSEIPAPPDELLKTAGTKIIESRKSDIPGGDLKVAGMIKCYEEELGRVLTPMDYEKLKDFADNYDDGWFEKAVAEAKKNKADIPMRYIEKILETWKANGEPTEGKSGTHRKKSATAEELKRSTTKPNR